MSFILQTCLPCRSPRRI